ncbi:MAG: cytochrome c oxidase assembly protein [Solirubrobacteraceae bacterium]|jgi:cytochrome c oxidase assembly factor CtaG
MPADVAPTIQWSPEPSVLVGVVALGVLYGLGWRRGRATGSPHRPGYGRLSLFAGGLLTILVALVSPIDALGSQLLVMHMVQHLLLLDIAPILLILGLNKVLMRPVTRRLHAIEQRAGYIAHPAFAVVFYVGVMWAWHVPAMYDAALRSTTVHAFEHVCFFTAGSLYWWHLLSPIRGRMRLDGMGPVAYMTVTKLLVGGLGVVLAFAPASFYPFYAHHPHYWGLSPSEDQSMAGLTMALEQSIVMGIALVYLFTRMLTESEREAQRAERFEVV